MPCGAATAPAAATCCCSAIEQGLAYGSFPFFPSRGHRSEYLCTNTHIAHIRADEYCAARTFTSGDGLSILIYTAEGACNNDKNEKPGTCSTSWVRYMIGEYQGRSIGPMALGGEGSFQDTRVVIAEGIVKFVGFTYGKSDPLCCPTVPSAKIFRVSGGRFVQVNP